MTTSLNQHSTTARRQRGRRPAHPPAREARTRRSDVAVLASYIRELWAGGGGPGGRPAAPAGERGEQPGAEGAEIPQCKYGT